MWSCGRLDTIIIDNLYQSRPLCKELLVREWTWNIKNRSRNFPGCCGPVPKYKLDSLMLLRSFSGHASPTIWSCYANFQSLSLYISLEINRFRGYKDGI